MKYLVCYNDHEVKSYHKTARITSPLIFKKSQATDILKKFVKSYNFSMREVNELDPNNFHLAILEAGEFVALPTDLPIASCVAQGTKLYVRQGRKSTEKEKKPAAKEITQAQPSVRVCARYGCMSVYDKKEHFGPCLYHKAPPVFLHNSMYWACCPHHVVSDFAALIKIRGCQITEACTLDDKEFLREMNENRAAPAPTSIEETSAEEKEAPTTDDLKEEEQFPADKVIDDPETKEDEELEIAEDEDIDDGQKNVGDDTAVAAQTKEEEPAQAKEEETAQAKEEESTPAGSDTHAVIHFRKVLHSFGFEDSTYDKLLKEARNEIPESTEMKDEDLLQNKEFKEKVGKMLEESLKLRSPASLEKDDAAKEEREAHDVDDEEDLVHVEMVNTKPEETEQQSQNAEIISNKTVDKEIESTSSPISIAQEYIRGAYSSLTKQLEVINKCCVPGPNPTAE